MDSLRRVLVLTSCTRRKDPVALSRRLAAERLYVGEQHRRLMRGVLALREASSGYHVDLRILSAEHGLVVGSKRLSAYDASFSGLGGPAIDERAEQLSVRSSLRRLLRRKHALVVLLLGEDYMRAAGIDSSTSVGGPAIAFGGNWLMRRGEELPLRVIPAGRKEARRYSCGVVGLKGELAGRLLELIADEPSVVDHLSDPDVEVLDLLDRVRGEPSFVTA